MSRLSIRRRMALSAAAVLILGLPLGALLLTWAFDAALRDAVGPDLDLDRAATLQVVLAFKVVVWLVMAGLALAVAAVMAAQVRQLLHPLRRLERDVARLQAGEIDRLPEDLPGELAPLSVALNALIAEQTAVIGRVRGQVSKLAHGLKTELAVAGRVLDDAPEQTPDAHGEVRAAVLRLARLVERYLERPSVISPGALPGTRVALAPLAEDFAKLMGRLHMDKTLTIVTAVPPDLTVRGDRGDVEEMLGILMDNACRHARTTVRLGGGTDGGGYPLLSVEDDGPGMSEEEIRAVLRRGVRLRPDEDGSGIGLALVEETMTLYDGALDFGRSPLGGLAVTLAFGPRQT